MSPQLVQLPGALHAESPAFSVSCSEVGSCFEILNNLIFEFFFFFAKPNRTVQPMQWDWGLGTCIALLSTPSLTSLGQVLGHFVLP